MIMRVSDFCPASLRERRNAPQVLTSSHQTTTTKAIDLLATTTTIRVTDRPITTTTTTDRQQVATTATRATDLHRQATSPNQAARIRAVATTARQATTRAATHPPATTTKVVNIETQSRLSPTQAGGELFLSPCLEICSYKRPKYFFHITCNPAGLHISPLPFSGGLARRLPTKQPQRHSLLESDRRGPWHWQATRWHWSQSGWWRCWEY